MTRGLYPRRFLEGDQTRGTDWRSIALFFLTRQCIVLVGPNFFGLYFWS